MRLVLVFVVFGLVCMSPKGEAASSRLRKRCGRLCRGSLHRMSHKRINRVLAHLQKKMGYQKRLQVLSEMFLRTPYHFGPLGEGKRGKWDRDPIFRLDKVDCVTYVETVMALALSRTVREAKQRMQQIRYDQGKIHFGWRNHFTAAQWLPVNRRAGYIKADTKQLAGKLSKPLRKVVAPWIWKDRAWRRWGRRLSPARRPRSFTIHYVPLANISKVLHRLPAIGWMGEIFSLPHSPVVVRHVGFFVRKRGTVYFRHANRPRVAEIPLARYTAIRRRLLGQKRRGVRVIGFSFATFAKPKPKP